MNQTMKIIYACLIVGGLCACGKDDSSGGDGQVQAFASEGSGELTFQSPSMNTPEYLVLKKGATEGSVYCDRQAAGQTVVAMGSFYRTTAGLQKNVPLTGLAVTLSKVQEAGEKIPTDVVLNVDSSFPSSPSCLVMSNGIQNSILSGTIQCLDNVERGTWGWVEIKGQFSCPM